ncbi:MAG TPA: hypothetical protein VHS97_16510 [Isosphaeraceae bacterium]|nr:hypothetical protein [Isosphaeraceae bacterium]
MALDRLKGDTSRSGARLTRPTGQRTDFVNGRRRAFGQIISVMLAVMAITYYVQVASRRQPNAPPSAKVLLGQQEPASDAEAGNAPDTAEPSVVAETPEPPQVTAPPEPQLDRQAVADAEGALDAASRDRARADDRAAQSARQLALATAQAAIDASRAKKLAFLVRDPSTRITQASSRGGFVRGERDKLEKELTTLRNLPRPKSVSILSKSPVARPAANGESHFELRRNRISFIDLDRLLDLTKADAQVRIRMSDRVAAITNKVGPVGSFSLEYELLKAVPGSVEELLERKSLRYDLRAWELVPEFENRGETYEATKNPISEFTRAVNRINPDRGTITFWIYPDSFTLYRRLRDDLVARGFSVAARPLPDGMSIRGSPMGTQSAAQ